MARGLAQAASGGTAGAAGDNALRRPYRRRRQTWRRIRVLGARALAIDNYVAVVLLIVGSILVVAAADAVEFPLPAAILFGATLVYALHASGVSARLQTLATLLVIAGVALAVGSAVVTGRTGLASGLDAAITTVLVVLTPIAIARRLIAHPAVNVSTVAGALCIYLLVGLFFAFLFRLTVELGLGPFFASLARAGLADYLYFSLSTLTTLGYGDLVARTDVGRMLAVTEALFGQMYLVTVVALLVGKFGRDRSNV